MQVASPSRERVEAYIQLRDEIELDGRPHQRRLLDTIGHTAIALPAPGYPREEMVALYLAADVMLVTALRDGMNLVAKEYVACRVDNRRGAGAQRVRRGIRRARQAVRVNPHDIEGLKDAIMRARSRCRARAGPAHAGAAPARARERRGEAGRATFLEALTGRAAIIATAA